MQDHKAWKVLQQYLRGTWPCEWQVILISLFPFAGATLWHPYCLIFCEHSFKFKC